MKTYECRSTKHVQNEVKETTTQENKKRGGGKKENGGWKGEYKKKEKRVK